jgi:hypothetical protein
VFAPNHQVLHGFLALPTGAVGGVDPGDFSPKKEAPKLIAPALAWVSRELWALVRPWWRARALSVNKRSGGSGNRAIGL